MPRALFTSKNLIGDSLYIQPAMELWCRDHEGWDVDLLTLKDHVTSLYEGMGIPNLRIIHERGEEPYDFEFDFNVSKAFSMGDAEKIHIVQAYAKMLGYEIQPPLPRVKYKPLDGNDHKKGLILFSLYSNSCASRGKERKPPNKMLPWAHWGHIIPILRQLGKVGFLGAKGEVLTGLGISQDEYYTGLPLEHVARMLRDARLLITIDNGMGHLAATQGTPTILFYPACLGMHWIVPSGNENVFVLQMDPARISTVESQIFVREALKKLWKD